MTIHITENCVICGTCWEICPTRSIVEHEQYYKVDDTCAQCGACIRVCPVAAITRKKGKKTSKAQ